MVEIYYTLELLAQLTFNQDIKQNMNESKIYEKIFDTLMKKDSKQLLNQDDKLIYSGIRQVIEQIQWNLNAGNKQSSIINSVQALSLNPPSNNQQHIMISYNSASRELCLKIKKEIESMGHKVWIDVNTISGSSLESMATAVENSWCVLMCVTEKYRQSINCQAEAKNDLNLIIFEHFKPCDGKILTQLFDTKQAATEFYIQPMSKIENVEFKDIMSFGASLDSLFKKK